MLYIRPIHSQLFHNALLVHLSFRHRSPHPMPHEAWAIRYQIKKVITTSIHITQPTSALANPSHKGETARCCQKKQKQKNQN